MSASANTLSKTMQVMAMCMCMCMCMHRSVGVRAAMDS
jgi:hypothetical protein